MERPPPYYTSAQRHDDPLKLPPVIDTSARSPQSLDTLPSLSHSLASLNSSQRSPPRISSHPPLEPLLPPLAPPSSRPTTALSHDVARRSTPAEPGRATSIVMDDSSSRKRDPSVSMDDPDDRMAAEALCGLGKVDSNRSVARSPSGYETPLQYYPIDFEHGHPSSSNDEPEPLLSLLTSSHPWLGGTINHSLSAYSSTKSNSPRFIQYGANFVERKIGNPMAHTVGSVGRKTGVEGSLRRYLGSRRPSELDRIDPEILGQEANGNKRRRISSEDETMDLEDNSVRRTLSGHASIDTLPVYDENRSPAYEYNEGDQDREQQQTVTNSSNSTSTAAMTTRRPAVSRSWSTQLMISTSGLGAALNQPSLRSLKYCLGILRSANEHVRNLMEALKNLLSDYDNKNRNTRGSNSSEHRLEEGGAMHLDGSDRQANEGNGSLAKRIQDLNGEIWATLKSVVNTVSRYTGGALPENASVVVRWQLMSVPRRWQRAVSSSSSASPPSSATAGALVANEAGPSTEPGSTAELEAVGNAHRMLAFAIEGIDMMDQVGGVVDSTILSAERWLDSLGRKSKQESGDAAAAAGASAEKRDPDTDIQMTDEAAPKQQQQQQPDDEMLVDTST